MKTNWRNRTTRWLQAERGELSEKAEEALQEVFRALAEPLVAAEFSNAVLRRIAVMRVTVAMPLRWRIATTALLLVVAISLAYMPLGLMAIAGSMEVTALVEFLGVVVVGASRAFVAWLSMWQSVAQFNGMLAKVVSTPQIASVLVATTALCLGALLALSRLMASKRSIGHV